MPEYSSAIVVVSVIMFAGPALPKALCITVACIFKLVVFVTGKFKKSSKLAAHAILSISQPAYTIQLKHNNIDQTQFSQTSTTTCNHTSAQHPCKETTRCSKFSLNPMTLPLLFASGWVKAISSLLHSVNLILFTVILVHLILRISPHHSHHPRSHHLSLPLPFTPDLKLISFTNPFLHITLIPSELPSWILTCTELKGHCFVCFSFWLRVLD